MAEGIQSPLFDQGNVSTGFQLGNTKAGSAGGFGGAAAGFGIDLIQFGVTEFFNSKARSKQLRELRRIQKKEDRASRLNRADTQRQFNLGFGLQREGFELSKEETAKNNRVSKFQRLRQLMLDEVATKSNFRDLFIERGFV